MYESNIEKMDFKQLRSMVRFLNDELSMFKRKYEDAIYNLDSDNFAKSYTIEQNGMKTQIKIAADAIKTMVSDTDLKDALKKYSTIEQTADAIQTVVSKGASLADAIKIESLDQADDIGKVYVIQETDDKGKVLSETYYYYNDLIGEWAVLSGDSIYTVFEQTAEGFSLKGNTVIDGDMVVTKNLTLSGIVTWDMDNSPVKSQYSSDKSEWYDEYAEGRQYMRMTFDGGKTWGEAVKIVGTDGKDGYNGSDGKDGVVDYSKINAILSSTYGITSTTLSKAAISSPTIYSAEIYSPNIYGENLILASQHASNEDIYNSLYLTPTSMYLKNAYKDTSNEAAKFFLDLGADTSNSSIKMRLGAGASASGKQALNIEKYSNEIRIGTYVNDSGGTLTDFAGMIIKPSTGEVTFTGTVQAVAVFG